MGAADMRRAVAAAIFEAEHGEPFSEATGVAEADYLDLADAAIRAMDRTDALRLLRDIVPLLEGSLDTLEYMAKLEEHREAGSPMRKVTHKLRFEAARKMVERGYAILGWDQ